MSSKKYFTVFSSEDQNTNKIYKVSDRNQNYKKMVRKKPFDLNYVL